ncbi:MAG: helix-turn-helix transcriptional regulator [Ktedonobacterales bacterium]|nr:helix-turn-helix transcriptional regulator [Ktedonobacterales bacterium]
MQKVATKLRGLRLARQRRGLSIGQLAELTGLRRETITDLEHGRGVPQPYALARLATALGACPADLYDTPTRRAD